MRSAWLCGMKAHPSRWAAWAAIMMVATLASTQIIVGQTAGFTGAVAATVKEAADGPRLYFDAMNARGGVNGRKSELISFGPKLAAQTR